MPINEHQPNSRGRAFLWGGIGLGLIFLAVVLTGGFGLFGASKSTSQAPDLMVRKGNKIIVPEGSALRERLQVAPALTQPTGAELLLPALIESDPTRTAAVLTPLSGRVVALKVALGDRVTQGQVVAVLDSPDFGQAVDDDAKAADALRLAEKNLARQEAQNKLGVASDRDLDQARSDHAQAAAEFDRTRARLKILGASGAAAPGSRLLTVSAPVAGSVTSLTVTPGNMINDTTQPLMSVADLSTVWVTALVSEKDVAAVSKNQDADISLVAYPDRVLHGKVSIVSAVIEPDSRRNKIRIALANPDDALKPNMFATVTLRSAAQPQVVVPSSALLMNNDRTSVFIATAPWTFERRSVDTELQEGSSVAVRSGIAAGDQVVVKGGILLND
jgi:membrane fusion protein, heavy metal efflux system